MRCDLKAYHECGCELGTCVAAPPKPLDIAKTPVFAVSARTQMILTVFASAVIVAVVVFVSAPVGMRHDHDLSLRNQEQIALRR